MTDRLQLVITELAMLGAGVFLFLQGQREVGLALIVAAVGGGGAKITLPALLGAAPVSPQVLPPAPPSGPSPSAMPPRAG